MDAFMPTSFDSVIKLCHFSLFGKGQTHYLNSSVDKLTYNAIQIKMKFWQSTTL